MINNKLVRFFFFLACPLTPKKHRKHKFKFWIYLRHPTMKQPQSKRANHLLIFSAHTLHLQTLLA